MAPDSMASRFLERAGGGDLFDDCFQATASLYWMGMSAMSGTVPVAQADTFFSATS